jgi:hypothetical protein
MSRSNHIGLSDLSHPSNCVWLSCVVSLRLVRYRLVSPHPFLLSIPFDNPPSSPPFPLVLLPPTFVPPSHDCLVMALNAICEPWYDDFAGNFYFATKMSCSGITRPPQMTIEYFEDKDCQTPKSDENNGVFFSPHQEDSGHFLEYQFRCNNVEFYSCENTEQVKPGIGC